MFTAVVSQVYDCDVNKAYVIRSNAAILKCEIPSFVADFVSVVSWHTDQDETFYPSTTDYGLSINMLTFDSQVYYMSRTENDNRSFIRSIYIFI